jgi:hypothetical protein
MFGRVANNTPSRLGFGHALAGRQVLCLSPHDCWPGGTHTNTVPPPCRTRPESPNYLPLLKPIIQANNSKGLAAPPPPPMAVQPPQQAQQAGPAASQQPLINLSSLITQHALQAHQAQSAQPPAYAPPLQRLQQLAGAAGSHAHMHQRQLSTAQSLSLSPMQSLSFTSASREALATGRTDLHVIPLHGSVGDSSSGARSVTSRPLA